MTRAARPSPGAYERIPGKSRNYVNKATGRVISRFAYDKLSATERGTERKKYDYERMAAQRRKKNVYESQVLDFQAEQQKLGNRMNYHQARQSDAFKEVRDLLQVRNKDGKLSQRAQKRALKLLGRREGLPNSVRVGDSGRKYKRDPDTGRWSLR